ncbi:hypothetical protein B5F40_01150 [Gordonibacter sp. An230]|uniref:hypothetical protein n=1 Tax=Gordonibacter sp. An230 TaxID=1965592 RepID=UPI000B399E39|nr:hypothetical protein [Gordonibacter sp. An230]OUO92528.1 hypothetical protein B5F40_01150 [Gordonibacter sp. An230]
MEENIKRRISAEPRYEKALYRILGDCLDPIAFSDLEPKICAYPEMHVQLYEPATLVSWLVESGALKASDAAEAADSGSDATDDGAVDVVLVATEAGERVWAQHEEADEVARLIETAGSADPAYRRVLELCRIPRSKREVEQALVAEGLLDVRKRQVSCYLDKLEKAGGLVWNKGWTTTGQGLTQLD